MNLSIFRYVNRKVRTQFENCQWYDGVGERFRIIYLPQMVKDVSRADTFVEQLLKHLDYAEELMSEMVVEEER